MTRINQSWREQRKAVVRSDGKEYQSLWMAAKSVCTNERSHSTAKKEIRKAIRTGCPRYGYKWSWKE